MKKMKKEKRKIEKKWGVDSLIIGKTEARLAQGRNSGDANQLLQGSVPNLNKEVTIQLKYLAIFGDLLIYL